MSSQKFLSIVILLVVSGIVFRGSAVRAASCTEGQTDFYGHCVSTLKLFGQNDFGEAIPGATSDHSVSHVSGIAIDRSSQPNKIYVIDSGNNRVLGFNGYSQNATLVFGQPDFQHSACNGDDNIGMFRAPTATSLCLTQYPVGTNVAEQWLHMNLDVDSQGNLYVLDVYNNRVLKYNQPFSSDKTGGKGDTVADFVWGQKDLTSNGINEGRGADGPSADSLYVSYGPPDNIASRGVSVDPEGNVWVADTFNNRILRFPPNSHTADLVIGRGNGVTSFTNKGLEGCNTTPMDSIEHANDWDANVPLDKVCAPMLARVDPTTGDLYVLDGHPPAFKTRILVFKAPLTSGMTASQVIKPELDQPMDAGGQVYWFTASTLAFNTNPAYPTGKIWVSEHFPGQRVLLLDAKGNIVTIIGARSFSEPGGDSAYYRYQGCGSIYDDDRLWWPSGSLGFDDQGNIYVADERLQHVSRYALPYTLRTVGGVSCLPDPNGGFLTANEPSSTKLSESIGMMVAGNQLIVRDHDRMVVWNNYLTKATVGSAADVVINRPGYAATHAVDDHNRLWTVTEYGALVAYQLPLTADSKPILENPQFVWSDTGEALSLVSYDLTVAFDPVHKALWLSRRNEMFRVQNYTDLTGKLVIDEVIGQPDKAHALSNNCNVDGTEGWTANGPPQANGVCDVSRLSIDKLGNLYAIENNYECHGNNRITVFLSDDIDGGSLFPNVSAKKVFVRTSLTEPVNCDINPGRLSRPVSIAFDSKNEMVVGTDGYYADDMTRQTHQLYFYADPLKKNADGSFVQGQDPDAVIPLPMGAPGEMWFDSADRLVVQDHTWPRIWVIDPKEKDASGNSVWLTSVAGANSWLASTSAAPTPTPTPSVSTPIAVPDTTDYSALASTLQSGDIASIAALVGTARDLSLETRVEANDLSSLVSGVPLISSQAQSALVGFIAYGVDTNTKALGEGERAAVLYSYRLAYGKLPATLNELIDMVKIANGRWPSEQSPSAEAKADQGFTRVYQRPPQSNDVHDNAAVTIMAYGLRQRAQNRNLESEATALTTFKEIFGHVPETTEEWNILQAITYSGAHR